LLLLRDDLSLLELPSALRSIYNIIEVPPSFHQREGLYAKLDPPGIKQREAFDV